LFELYNQYIEPLQAEINKEYKKGKRKSTKNKNE